jgi:hypothetical protein
MIHPSDQPQLVHLTPPATGTTHQVLASLAGVGHGPRRIWAGQPGPRSPWLPCRGGCCLVLEPSAPITRDAADWLRFLVREVLWPEAAASLARGRALSLGSTRHRLHGEVLLDDGATTRLLVAAGRRVRVVPLEDDLLPLPSAVRPPRHAAEVVELAKVARGRDG